MAMVSSEIPTLDHRSLPLSADAGWESLVCAAVLTNVPKLLPPKCPVAIPSIVDHEVGRFIVIILCITRTDQTKRTAQVNCCETIACSLKELEIEKVCSILFVNFAYQTSLSRLRTSRPHIGRSSRAAISSIIVPDSKG